MVYLIVFKNEVLIRNAVRVYQMLCQIFASIKAKSLLPNSITDIQPKIIKMTWPFWSLHVFWWRILFFYPPSSGIASCVRTDGTVTWHLHLTRHCYVALGWVLIWVMCPDWFEELYLNVIKTIKWFSHYATESSFHRLSLRWLTNKKTTVKYMFISM